jgi:hypothetical protein
MIRSSRSRSGSTRGHPDDGIAAAFESDLARTDPRDPIAAQVRQLRGLLPVSPNVGARGDSRDGHRDEREQDSFFQAGSPPHNHSAKCKQKPSVRKRPGMNPTDRPKPVANLKT